MKKFARKVWNGWKKIALKIGRFQTALFLSIFYFLILVPVGFVFKLFGWDPLETRRPKRERSSNWKAVSLDEPDLEDLRRQS